MNNLIWKMWISDNMSLTEIASTLNIKKSELNKIIK